MIEYRGHLSPPLANAPTEFLSEVERVRRYGGAGVLAVAVCDGAQHPLVTVLDTSFGRVAVWVPARRAWIQGKSRILGGEWVATIGPNGIAPCRARCRCSRASVDVDRLLDLASGTSKRRVRVGDLR